MIGTLRGTVIEREVALEGSLATELTIEVAGVGYRVSTTAATLSRLPGDEEVLLYVHHHIRESDQKLFGFLAKEERRAFEGLLSAHGVGPALALAVLATHSVPQLAAILNDEDVTALCEVPGVGKKTAQRLLVELKSSLVLPVVDGMPTAGIDLTDTGINNPLADVKEALVNLGYSAEEARSAVVGLRDEAEGESDSGILLKQALTNLAQG